MNFYASPRALIEAFIRVSKEHADFIRRLRAYRDDEGMRAFGNADIIILANMHHSHVPKPTVQNLQRLRSMELRSANWNTGPLPVPDIFHGLQDALQYARQAALKRAEDLLEAMDYLRRRFD